MRILVDCYLFVISLWYRSCCSYEIILGTILVPLSTYSAEPQLLPVTFSHSLFHYQGWPSKGILWQLLPTAALTRSRRCCCFSLLGSWISLSNLIQHSQSYSQHYSPWILLPPSSASHSISVPIYNLPVYNLAVIITDIHCNLKVVILQQLCFNRNSSYSQAGHVE